MPASVATFIWSYLSKLKFGVFGVLLCIIGGEVFYRFFTYFSSEVADILTSGESKDVILQKSIINLSIAVGFIFLHRISYDSIVFIDSKIIPLLFARLNKNLFNYVHKHSTAFFAEEMAGNIASKIKTMVENSIEIYFNLVWGFGYPLFSFISIFYFMASISFDMAMIMLIANVIYIFFIYKISQKISPYSKTSSKTKSETQGVLVDSITNAATVKSFDNYFFEKKSFFKSVKVAARAENKNLKKFAILLIYQSVFRFVIQAIFCFLPLYYWYQGKITIGNFVFIQTLSASLSGLYLHFTQTFMRFFKLHGGLKDGLEMLSRPYEVANVPNAKPLNIKKASISFNKVKYHYKGADALFKDFSFDIKAGEKIGLVGHSGSGKSTLVKLISRYYDIQSGSIKIDNQDISQVTQESLRKNIALIPQDTSLFNRTIMENIRYGNVKATDEDVINAAKKAFIHDTIMQMPKGYESKVGERGVMLSGGERQRIAIARAILKNAPILILDEATSALDSQSEKYIQDSIKELMKGKTVIAIAHRLSTLKEMDRLVVMDKGKVVETGSHSSLLRKKGAYHSFYEMQSQGFINL